MKTLALSLFILAFFQMASGQIEDALKGKEIFKNDRPQVKSLVQKLVTERRALRTLVQAETIAEPAIRVRQPKQRQWKPKWRCNVVGLPMG